MIIKIIDKGLLIEPETQFEYDYFSKNYSGDLEAYLKCGLTPSEVIGIKICPKVDQEKK